MTKLVIVDDHEALREGLAALLESHGMEVVGAAGNVAAGADLIEHADPDVAIVDIRLPDGSGIDLTRDALRRRPDLGVVLYTGDADAELLYSGLDSGARGYALKAGSMRELVDAIDRIATGGSYVDPRLDRILLSPRATAQVPHLSPREREIMHHMAIGQTAEQIGTELGVSVETVRTHVRNVIRKLQARNRVHAIAMALERGEIALDAPAHRVTMPADDELRALVHDLRTPLTIVEGFSDLLVRRGAELDAAERDDCARRIVAAAEEMRALLDRALAP